MPQTLAQLVAEESAARAETNKRTGALDKSAQKPHLFSGFTQVYQPFAETDDEQRSGIRRLPPKGNIVQLRAEVMLTSWLDEARRAVNLARYKDDANCLAAADVIVHGDVLLRDVPAAHLLHMEKVLADLGTFISHLPVVNPDNEWHPGPDGLKRTDEEVTVRDQVKKVPLLLHPPTKDHAAQVAVIDETVPLGRWTKTDYSGALDAGRKRDLELRVTDLRNAFRAAREKANGMEVPNVRPDEAAALFGYLLG